MKKIVYMGIYLPTIVFLLDIHIIGSYRTLKYNYFILQRLSQL